MKIGIFGGTFDPPHNVHVSMAREALSQLQLDKLIVMPCGDPPHKRCDADKRVRLQMCRAAFGDFAEVSDYEINLDGKSYTVNTLLHFAEQYKGAQLYLIVGGDSLASFDKWYRPKDIAKLCTLAVAQRGGNVSPSTVSEAERKFGAKVVLLQMTPSSLSSTEIRLRYDFGLDNGDLVPAAVDRCVSDNGLYRKHSAMTQAVSRYLTPRRFEHTFYVVKRGQELARDDVKEKAFVACLLHDVAKYIPESDYGKYRFTKGDLPDSVVHSFLGSYVAYYDFGIDDRDILRAIAYHTTGRPDMSELEKLVYVADKTEDTRPYPLEHLKRGTLDEQFVACLKEAYRVCLQRHCDSLSPLSELTIRWYCAEDFGLRPLTADACKEEEIKSNNKEKNNMTEAKESLAAVQQICKVLAEKQATDIKIVEIRALSDLADYFVICSGRSIPQVKAIFDHLEEQMEKQGRFAARKEGYSEGRWIAVDYGDVIVHIFHKDTREVYGLDNLWNNGGNVTDYNAD